MKTLRLMALAAVFSLASTSAAMAQRTRLEVADSTMPTCAETGVQRVAVMVPPGKTRDEIAASAAEGGLFPQGTQVVILNLGEYTPIRNQAELSNRMNLVLTRFLDEGTQIDGTVSVLLAVDENGVVTQANPHTGNSHVDRMVGNAWKTARFAPYALGGCRMKAWVSVPLTLTSDWTAEERRVEMRPATP